MKLSYDKLYCLWAEPAFIVLLTSHLFLMHLESASTWLRVTSTPGTGCDPGLEPSETLQLTNQNSVHQQIKCRNSCYYSVQTLLSSRLLSKNLKIKICKTIELAVVLYGCEAWSLTLREESRIFENRILRLIVGANRDDTGEWRRLHNEEPFT